MTLFIYCIMVGRTRAPRLGKLKPHWLSYYRAGTGEQLVSAIKYVIRR
ncbi:MAG: hypothetical protein IKD19_07420 [Prevotella sp.]|nr:hypothetical protein [Prevotella sp.]MBR7172019.1 hypothetical protein [Prevotella sp.]